MRGDSHGFNECVLRMASKKLRKSWRLCAELLVRSARNRYTDRWAEPATAFAPEAKAMKAVNPTDCFDDEEGTMELIRKRLSNPYWVLVLINVLMIAYALIVDNPRTIARGLWDILSARGVLITDYVVLGGPGAALVNAALASFLTIAVMCFFRIQPNGAIIMGIWLNLGFALFGKNPLNMLPLMLGVWCYSRVRREPVSNFALMALLSATLAPMVSEIALTDLIGGLGGRFGAILSGIVAGIFFGFIFPPVASYVVRVHGGYNLYNMGFAGGLLSTAFVASLHSAGIQVDVSLIWASGHNIAFAVLLYGLSAVLVLLGFWLGNPNHVKDDFNKMMRQSGRLVTDFYLQYKENAYVNMGLLCAFSTTLVLVLGGDLNGPTIGGIFTITGFGCFGKHLKNILPILTGSILSSGLNQWAFTSPSNMLAILFSTCLAPIAGQFGALWGIAAGFIHVRVVHHAGYLSNGFNLYNNGFAAGFVVMFLLPLIMAFRKEHRDEANI